ncbi:hypothetical protein [Nonomuraea sp. LPB2021202275-12-8]|uniref:hypothetical protein n=1 Tax=Nonomuraea sp. LPB2021202275-12-8 TaxID=3120159 RepID=UPI00300C39DC
MSSRSDIDKVIAAAQQLELETLRCGSRIQITNPRTRKLHKVSIGTAGSSLDKALTTVRQLGRDTPPHPTEGTPDMSREAWWPPRELLMRARRAGVVVWVSGGVLQTSAGPEADYLVRRLRDRADEIIPLLTPALPPAPQATPHKEDNTTMPTIGETATITRASEKQRSTTPPTAPRWDVAEHARLVWEFARDEAKEQGNRPLTWHGDGRQGVLWEGSFRSVCAELTRHQREDVSRYLAQTLNMRCDSQRAKPHPRWWVAPEWSSGDLTVTKPAAAHRPLEAAAPQDVPKASPGNALEALTVWTESASRLTKERDDALERACKAEQRVATAEKERDEALAERDSACQLLIDKQADLSRIVAERDELAAYKTKVDAAFAQLNNLR